MSEKKPENKKQSPAAIIATAIVAAAAIAAVVILLVMKNNQNTSTLPDGTQVTFKPSADLVTECEYQAHDLVSESYEVIKLFVTEGLPHLDEPYGNAPEDGIYTVNSDKYTSLEQIEELVKSVYTDEAADKILHNLDGNGLEVYKNREIYVEAEYSDEAAETGDTYDSADTGETYDIYNTYDAYATAESSEETTVSRPNFVKKTVLGINAEFVADENRAPLWSQCSILPTPISDTECALVIYLGGSSESDSSETSGENLVLQTSMVKTNGEWKLTDFVY